MRKDDRISFICNSSASDTAGVYEIRIDSLCGMDGGKSLSATVRQRYAAAYHMVPEKILTRFVQKILDVC